MAPEPMQMNTNTTMTTNNVTNVYNVVEEPKETEMETVGAAPASPRPENATNAATKSGGCLGVSGGVAFAIVCCCAVFCVLPIVIVIKMLEDDSGFNEAGVDMSQFEMTIDSPFFPNSRGWSQSFECAGTKKVSYTLDKDINS